MADDSPSAPTATEIRQRMQALREHLGPDVDDIVDNARELLDWRYYVETFPWGTLAAAAALGYLAVPRKLEIVSPDPAALEKLAKRHRLVVEHQPRAEQKPGLLGTMLNLTSNMLLRAALAYMGQKAGRMFGEASAEASSGASPGEVAVP